MKPLAALVLPVMVEQLLALSVGFVDKWLAGNLFTGPEPLAAVGLVAYCLAFLPVLFAMPVAAVTALVARHVGAGEPAAARRSLAQCGLVAVVPTIAMGLVAVAFGGRLVDAMGLPPESSLLARRYLGIVIPALPAMAVIWVGVAGLRGAGDMVAGFVSMSVVNLVNAAASYALATGALGLPRLGWEGLAWGTVAGYCCGAACVLAFLAADDQGLRPRREDWRVRGDWLRRIVRVGMPAGIDAGAYAACHLTFLSIVNRLGNVDAAAHAVAVTIESLAFLPGSAFQVAAATLVGQHLGARDDRRARSGLWTAAAAAAVLMGATGAMFYRFADPLASWFVGAGGGRPVAELAAALVRIVAFAQPPLALLMVLSGGLRGGGATRPPLVVNFLGLVAIRLPLAVMLSAAAIPLPGGLGTLVGMGLGARGAWLAMAADLAVRGLAMAAIVARPGWTRVRV